MNEKSPVAKMGNDLYSQIRLILNEARSSAYRAVNFAMVQAYWRIGMVIVEYEQEGESRAEYGKAVLEDLSKRLTYDFGKGYSVQNLRYMRQFYVLFRKRHALRGESVCPRPQHLPALHQARTGGYCYHPDRNGRCI